MVSLNIGSDRVRYDLRIDSFIEAYSFPAELVLNFKLPYLLPRLNECYIVQVGQEWFPGTVFEGNGRHIIFAGTRNWDNSQKISPRYSTLAIGTKGNVVLYTSLTIAYEVLPEELSKLKGLNCDNQKLVENLKKLLQSAMEIISYRYNEKSDGRSNMSISFADCDRIQGALFENYINKRLLRGEFITPNQITPDSNAIDETPISRSDMAEDPQTWIYFRNKSRYSYLSCEYVDSIISAAICIESLILGLAKKYCQENNIDEKTYTFEDLNDSDGNQISKALSLAKLVKKLLADGAMESTLSKKQLIENIYKVLSPRNDIMHGKVQIAQPWGTIASTVNNALNTILLSISIPNSQSHTHTPTHIIENYRSQQKSISNATISPADRLELAEQLSSQYPSYEYLKIVKIQLLLLLGRQEEASAQITSLMNSSRNRCATAMAVFQVLFRSKKYAECFSLLKDFDEEEKDQRMLVAEAELNYLKYSEKGEKQYLDQALKIIEQSFRFNDTYLLRSEVARKIYRAIGNCKNRHPSPICTQF